MPEKAVAGPDVAEIAASSLALPHRAQQMLTVLRRLVPFDSAWLALADPHHPRYATAAAADLADSTLALFTSPQQARDIEATGTDRARPPLSPSDLPFPVEELPGWAECLIPAGYREGFAVALFGPGGRHVGFLATLSGDRGTPAPELRRAPGALLPGSPLPPPVAWPRRVPSPPRPASSATRAREWSCPVTVRPNRCP